MKPIFSIAIIAGLLFLSAQAWAKRSGPAPVSVTHEGVRYEAVHFGSGTEKKIQATDAKTDAKLWDLEIYRVQVDPNLERDVQEVFINSMKIQDHKLIMTNEDEEEFIVDLTKRKVISKKIRGREAYSCKADADCMTTCAQGAINASWHEANKKGLAVCKDGCTRIGTKPARCIDGICTRIGRDNQPDASCTRKLLWFYTP